MRFIVDAQLPYGIKLFLQENGFDTIHTDDMPNRQQTFDREILELSEFENRIIITKDKDFLDSHLLFNKPKKLVQITTGNINNKAFFLLFKGNYKIIIDLLSKHSLLELNTSGITGK